MFGHARLPLWEDQCTEQKLDTMRQLVLHLYRVHFSNAVGEVLAMLDAHQPGDAKEASDIQMIKQLIAQHPNIFCPNCEAGHITASALIVDATSLRTLLHYHKRLRRWLQVGGHADYETEIAQVALREAREETGLSDLSFFPPQDKPVPIDFDVHVILQHGDIPQHHHLDFRYLLLTRCPDVLSPSAGESTQFKWLSFDDALAFDDEIDASLKRLLRKGRSICRNFTVQD